MASKATSTQGIQLKRGNGAGTEVFTKIAEVTSFNGPNETASDIEVTSFDSESQEFISGLSVPGEIQLELLFVGDDAQQQGLREDMLDKVIRNFELVLNDHATSPSKFEFPARVTAFSIQGGTNEAVKASCTLKLNAPAEFTPRSGA